MGFPCWTSALESSLFCVLYKTHGELTNFGPIVEQCLADSAEHADAACAGLENLARTLSIEWARHGITPVTIAPGASAMGEAAALVAYLASPAGAYFSGCLLDLPGVAGA